MKRRRPRNADSGWLARWLARLRPALAGRDEPIGRRPLAVDVEAQLRANERIWSGFRALELQMLAAESLSQVVEIVARQLPARFPAVSAASLAWLDPDHEVTRLLADAPAELRRAFIALPASPSASLVPRDTPYLGSADAEVLALLFPHHGRALRSVAIAPLRLRGAWVGCLSQASEDPRHFNSAAATDLLEHLAAITALCVENAVNRARLQRDGLTDPLTAVANRRFFERRLHEAVSYWRRHGSPLSCLLVDLDRFKLINDSYGHPVGDRVLREVARVMSQGLRTSDLLARYGGEEFILLLPDTGLAHAGEIAERLRAAVARTTIVVSDRRLEVTVSIGVASLDARRRDMVGEPGAWLLQRADAALYEAKGQGRDRVRLARAEEVATRKSLIRQ